MNNPKDIIHLIRPLQWIKNGFVFTGLLFSGGWSNHELVWTVCFAAIAFCLASSSIYVLNDLIDCENDRFHPKKKNRPLPAGTVSVPMAIFLSGLCGLGSLLLAAFLSYKVFLIIVAYILLNIAYTLRLKHVVILDVFCISAGFMLRILVGTVGVGIPPSKWLLLCGLLVTLFLGFAKRRAELIALKQTSDEHRQVLKNYGPLLLDEIIAICATGVIITYSLYTMSPETVRIHKTENLIYTVPFVIYAIFRYIYLLHHTQGGGDPTKDLLRDKHIIASVICWAVLTFYFL